MRIQTTVSDEDFEILSDICDEKRISVSALASTLVTDFLECTDKERVAHIITEAQKIKSGRPKQGW